MKNNIVLGVIGADCHAVGNRILDHVFTEAGFKVINIGVMNTQEDFINAAIETNAYAILVSSLYGHGELDCRGMREKCQEKGLGDILLYVGGNLVVGKQDWEQVEKRFLDMGYDRVFSPSTPLDMAVSILKNDLVNKVRGDLHRSGSTH